MAKGRFGRWPDEQLRAHGRMLLDEAERAAALAGGWRTQRLAVGSTVVEVRTVDPAIDRLIRRATAHLATDAEPQVTLSVCDTASAGVAPPPEPAWALDHWRNEGEHTVLYADRERATVAWSDAAAGEALWWIPDEAAIPPWERPAPLRTLLDRLLGPAGATFVHAGVVGDERGGVLLAGRGGSGKSSTIVACVADGLRSGGDDFLVVEDGAEPIVAWSLYATARLVPSSPAWGHVDLDPAAIEVPSEPDAADPNRSKRTVYLAEAFPGSVERSFPLRALVVPTVVDADRSVLAPLRPAHALRALAPSSMLQLDPRASSLRSLAALVGRLPCWALALGRDTERLPAMVRALLADEVAR